MHYFPPKHYKNGFVMLNKSMKILLEDTSDDEDFGDSLVRLIYCFLPLCQYGCIDVTGYQWPNFENFTMKLSFYSLTEMIQR